MKLLTAHSEYIEFKPVKKALDDVEEVPKEKERIDECLVVFIGSEEKDEENVSQVAEKASEEIKEIAGKVGTKKVVLYPWVHLTGNPSSPKTAERSINEIEKELSDSDLEIHKSPFGYYKQFELKVKGHPLAELSREISPGEEEKEGPAKEREEEEEFFKFILIGRDGEEHLIEPGEIEENEFLNKEENKDLKDFVKYEIGEEREKKEKPAHIDLMKDHELVDYCEVSDVGHFKWHPKGLLIKELILKYQDKLAEEYGAFKVQNPLVYRMDNEQIEKLIGEFQEKIYSWKEGNKELVLRPASDPGAFPYVHNLGFSYKQMPIKEYEEAPCFRKEQRGELTGLKRVRNFLMTDLHAFTKNHESAKKEFEELSHICKDLMNSIISKGNWVMGWEGTEKYWKENKEWMKKVNKEMNAPGLVKLAKKRSHYFSMKNEFQAIHPDGSATQVATVQVDEVNGKRFDISYTGKDGKDHPCTILHCSTFGSIERTLSFMLEDSMRNPEEHAPQLPLWLAPTQVRMIPISDEFLEDCQELSEKIPFRTDIDDRQESVSKKIRKSEKEWVPYTVVFGGDEKESGELSVRVRGEDQKKMRVDQLIEELKKITEGKPFQKLSLPKKLSKRPSFKE